MMLDGAGYPPEPTTSPHPPVFLVRIGNGLAGELTEDASKHRKTAPPKSKSEGKPVTVRFSLTITFQRCSARLHDRAILARLPVTSLPALEAGLSPRYLFARHAC